MYIQQADPFHFIVREGFTVDRLAEYQVDIGTIGKPPIHLIRERRLQITRVIDYHSDKEEAAKLAHKYALEFATKQAQRSIPHKEINDDTRFKESKLTRTSTGMVPVVAL